MIRSPFRFSSISVGLAALGVIASSGLWGGCGVSAASLCERVCECQGCSENERAECIDELEDAQRKADNEGCSDQYSALLSCFDSELECRDSEVDVDGCDPEEKSL